MTPSRLAIFRGAALALALLSPASLLASQVVALNMKPLGKIPKAATETMTPILITELSRREGISVVSQFDIIALLEHEQNKQMIGCDDQSCFTQIAGAMGAELMLASTLGKVGSEWVVTLTLVDTRTSVPVKRGIGREKGEQAAANIALVKAVNDLFSTGLPSHLQGPGSMSQRGFKAALLGLGKALLEPGQEQNARDLRQRIVLDLVNTELDFDVEPKMKELDLAAKRGNVGAQTQMLVAKDTKEAEHLLSAALHWQAVGKDLSRVKEIRTRARERGVAPSGRALRFEPPEPIERVPPKDLERWQKASNSMQRNLKKLLTAFRSENKEAFSEPKLWANPKRAGSTFDSLLRKKKQGYSYEPLPFHGMTPWRHKEALDAFDHNQATLRLYLREFKKGQIRGIDVVYCEKVDGEWKFRNW